MDLLEQLKHSLECPCCLETPKPDTTTVGMCSSGHTTCHSCGIKVLEKSTACPVCRQTTFQIVRGHKLAVSVIAIMTSFMIYSCKHANCQAQVTGDQLTRHEETCSKKPLLCPKKHVPIGDPWINTWMAIILGVSQSALYIKQLKLGILF